MRRRAIFFPLALLLSVVVCAPQYAERPVANPHTVSALDGKFKLRVKSLTPDGLGSSICVLTQGQKTIWEKTLPYTYAQSFVTDEGVVGGYGVRPNKDRYGEGFFVVSIFSPTGESRLTEETKLEQSRFLHTESDPKSPGLVVDVESDVLVVRVDDPDVNVPGEAWWKYRISTGQRLGITNVGGPSEGVDRGIFQAQAMPGTRLFLTANYRFDGQMGQSFILYDLDGNALWRKDIGGDFENGNSDRDKYALRERVMGVGTILEVKKDEFKVHHVKSKLDVVFTLSKSDGKWIVEEKSSSPHVEKRATTPNAQQLPIVAISPVSKVTLPVSTTKSDIRDIGQFLFWENKVVFVRNDEKPVLCIAELNGTVTKKIALPASTGISRPDWNLAHTSGPNFLVFCSSLSDKAKASSAAWLVNVSTGKISSVPEFRSFSIRAVAAAPNGCFVVLASDFGVASLTDHLTYHKPNGKLAWSIVESGYGDTPEELLSPEDVDIDSKGNVVVLDNILNTLHCYRADGTFFKRIDLEKAWGREPSYPTEVTCLDNGGYWIYDSGDDQTCNLLGPTGKIIRSHGLKFANGKQFESFGAIKVDGQSRPWISNRNALMRVNEHGVAVQTIGRISAEKTLGEISGVHVSLDGRIYAQDRATNSVFVFDHKSKPLFSVFPKPTEFNDFTLFTSGPTVTRSGDIYLGGSTNEGTPHWSPTGKRLKDLPDTEDSEDPTLEKLFDTRPTWQWQGSKLINEEGVVQAVLQRWPNEDWMTGGPSAFAPDGRIMSYECAPRTSTDEAPTVLRLGFFSARGKPEGEAKFALGGWYVLACAFDGNLCYFTTVDGLLAVDRSGKGRWLLPLPNGSWDVFCSRGGLALFDGKQTILWIDPSKVVPGKKTIRFPTPASKFDD